MVFKNQRERLYVMKQYFMVRTAQYTKTHVNPYHRWGKILNIPPLTEELLELMLLEEVKSAFFRDWSL